MLRNCACVNGGKLVFLVESMPDEKKLLVLLGVEVSAAERKKLNMLICECILGLIA